MASDEPSRPRPPGLFQGITVLAFGLLYLPLVAVIVYSFVIPVDTPEGRALHWGLRWYRSLFQNPQLGTALLQSLQIAAGVALLSSLVGGLGAVALERGRFPGRDLLMSLTLVPLVLPELVLGLAFLIWFATLRLTLGAYSVVLAHVTFALSYVIVTVRARLRDFDTSLEEAAADLGAPPWMVLRRVTLPLIAPGVLAGGVMAFTLSFDDFLISFLTAGPGVETLPMRLYSMVRFGLSREVYALSSLLVLVTVAGLGVKSWIQRSR